MYRSHLLVHCLNKYIWIIDSLIQENIRKGFCSELLGLKWRQSWRPKGGAKKENAVFIKYYYAFGYTYLKIKSNITFTNEYMGKGKNVWLVADYLNYLNCIGHILSPVHPVKFFTEENNVVIKWSLVCSDNAG